MEPGVAAVDLRGFAVTGMADPVAERHALIDWLSYYSLSIESWWFLCQ